MSLIPPTPIIMSKLKYHIRTRLLEVLPEMCMKTLEKLGPFPVFRLLADFRSLENGTINPLLDVETYIESKTIEWDDIDTAVNMFVKMRKYLVTNMTTSPGVLKLSLQSRPEGEESSGTWSDIYIDEFPINVKGLVKEKENVDNNNNE